MKPILFILTLLTSLFCYAQEGLEFSSNTQLYLKGNSVLIGNNSVSEDAKKPFDDNSEFNDVLKMEYVDVDDDKSTFSSSQANLNIPETASKIKYAALYWSAIYKYDKGTRKIINNEKMVYRGKDERSEDVNTILFKTPENKYQTLTGTVVYDSYKTNLFNDTKPYVCFADVTSLLQNLKNPNGTYTVANIKATEGYVSGGCAAGWLLYVVYESETETPKYFTTYNGFVAVDKAAVDIQFKDFKTDEAGAIKTSLLLGALEGDQKFKSDQCAILDAKKIAYVSLFNKIRPKNNFFNSTITTDDAMFTDRTPNSSNTLGFDLLKMEIPNKNNTIISNNSSEATIQFKTKADGFYLFFVAFETEISPIYLEEKSNTETLVVFDKSETDETIEQEVDTLKVVKVVSKEIPKEIHQAKPKKKTPLERIKSIKSIHIPNLAKGYYLVTNVFSVQENATKWMKVLEEKGYTPKSYINPKNGWNYIYLKNDEDPNAIYQKQKELSKLADFQNIWILKINY